MCQSSHHWWHNSIKVTPDRAKSANLVFCRKISQPFYRLTVGSGLTDLYLVSWIHGSVSVSSCLNLVTNPLAPVAPATLEHIILTLKTCKAILWLILASVSQSSSLQARVAFLLSWLLTSISSPSAPVTTSHNLICTHCGFYWSRDQSELQVQDHLVITWCVMVSVNIYWLVLLLSNYLVISVGPLLTLSSLGRVNLKITQVRKLTWQRIDQ